MRLRRTTPHRSRRLPLLVLLAATPLALLAGCSKHTAVTVKADLAPFLSSAEKQANVSYPSGSVDIQLPVSSSRPNPGELIDLTKLGVPSGAAKDIDSLTLDLAGTVTPTSSLAAGNADVYIAPSGTTDAFQPSYLVASVATPPLPSNVATAVAGHVALTSAADPAALQRIRSGSFRLGVAIRASAAASGSAHISLEHLRLTVSLPPGWGVP